MKGGYCSPPPQPKPSYGCSQVNATLWEESIFSFDGLNWISAGEWIWLAAGAGSSESSLHVEALLWMDESSDKEGSVDYYLCKMQLWIYFILFNGKAQLCLLPQNCLDASMSVLYSAVQIRLNKLYCPPRGTSQPPKSYTFKWLDISQYPRHIRCLPGAGYNLYVLIRCYKFHNVYDKLVYSSVCQRNKQVQLLM